MMFTRPLSDQERFLSLAARSDRTPSERGELHELFYRSPEPDWRDLALRNKAGPLIGTALLAEGLPISEEWEREIHRNGERVSTLTSELKAVTSDLEKEGCLPAVIEGGGTLMGSDLPTAAYCAGDFDILVAKGSWESSLQILRDHGYEIKDRRSRPTKRIEFGRTIGEWVSWLEIGYAPADRMWVPLHFIDRSQLWVHRRTPAKKDPSIRVLHPTDAVVMAALHASLHSFVRAPGIRLYVDIDRTARDDAVDWTRVAEEIFASRIATRAYVSFRLAKDLLGTPIPPEVLNQLAPSPAKAKRLGFALKNESVFAREERKLRGPKAIVLDEALADGRSLRWLRFLVLPPSEWMKEHFDREKRGLPLWRLHLRRVARALRLWRPE